MSEAQVELLEGLYAALDRDSLESGELPSAFFAAEIEFDYSRLTPGGHAGRGTAEFAKSLLAWANLFEGWTVEAREFIEAGPDKVIAVVRDGGRIKATGAEVHNEFVHLWSFRDDRAVRFAAFPTRDEAEEAAAYHESR